MKNPVKKFNLPVDYTKLNAFERSVVRKQYARDQDGKCYYCGGNLDVKPNEDIMEVILNKSAFPKGFFSNPVHLHHDHDTGMTEGAVHARCNAVLWQYFNK